MTDTLALQTFHRMGFMGTWCTVIVTAETEPSILMLSMPILLVFVGSFSCHSGFDCLRELCFLRLLFQLFHFLMPLLCKFIDPVTFTPTCPSKQMTLLPFLLTSCGAPLFLLTCILCRQAMSPMRCTWGKRFFSMLKVLHWIPFTGDVSATNVIER